MSLALGRGQKTTFSDDRRHTRGGRRPGNTDRSMHPGGTVLQNTREHFRQFLCMTCVYHTPLEQEGPQ